MKKTFKTLISAILILSTLSTSFLSTKVYAKDLEETKVIIMESAANVPEKIIQELIAENPYAGVITIYEYSEIVADDITESILSYEEPITPYLVHIETGPVQTLFQNKSQNVLLDDQFKFSVAKGETVTLQTDIEVSFKGSISGTILDRADVGAEVTIKGKFSKGTVYKGPEESSPANSREFRAKIYGETGTYKQQQITTYKQAGMPDMQTIKYAEGTYVKPTHWLSYNVDRIIK